MSFETPEQIKFELAIYEFMLAGQEILSEADPERPETLSLAVQILLHTARATPAELSAACGSSQMTVSRWRDGQTIPRSSAYRKWVVNEFIKLLHTKTSAPPELLSIKNG